MFVLVPASSTATLESIKTLSLTSNKLYFMAKYNQIVAKGTTYGVDSSTSVQLETLINAVGGSVAGDGTVTVDFSALNYYASEGTKTIIGAINALDAKIKSEMDKLAASKTLNDNYEFSGSLAYVPAAEGKGAYIALKDETGKDLYTVNVSDIIGNGVLKTSAYDAATGVLTLTFGNADGTTNAISVDLKAMLDINDISIADNSKKYLEVTLGTAGVEGDTQAVFGAKIVKVAEATDSVTGLVDAKDAKDYVDGQVKTVNDRITTEIGKLKVEETTVSESGEGAISFKYSETAGKVAISDLSVTYATHSANTISTGIVNGTVLNDVLGDMWETYVDA